MKKIDQTTQLFSLKIFSSLKKTLLILTEQALKNSAKTLVLFTPNPEQVMLAQRDATFASCLGEAGILVPDGIGLVLTSRLYALFGVTQPIAERITGVELAADLLSQAQELQKVVLVVGGRGYAGKQFALTSGTHIIQGISALSSQERQKHTVWWTQGYQNVGQPTAIEEQELVSQIQALKPDIVMVCFGAPNQEQWVIAHRELLQKTGVQLALVVGGAFDMLLGIVPRAPKYLQKLGLEWLFRLLQQPWRIGRQLRLLQFGWFVLTRGLVLSLRHSQKP